MKCDPIDWLDAFEDAMRLRCRQCRDDGDDFKGHACALCSLGQALIWTAERVRTGSPLHRIAQRQTTDAGSARIHAALMGGGE